MYAKIKNNTVIQYPYDFNSLQEDNPHTSFDNRFDLVAWFEQTEAASDSMLVNVTIEEQPEFDASKQNIKLLNTPTLVNSEWVLSWEITKKTKKEIADYSVVLQIPE